MRRLIPGCEVQWQGRIWVVIDLEGLDSARLQLVNGKRQRIAPVSALQLHQKTATPAALNEISSDEWHEAIELFQAIRPLLERPASERSVAEVDAVAAKLGKCQRSVYGYLATWKRTGKVSGFLRKTRTDKGTRRLPVEVWDLIRQNIEQRHLVEEQPTLVLTWESIVLDCRNKGLPAPSLKTVSNAVKQLSPRELARGRLGRKIARERFEPIRGSFPGADFPLAVVQIDHTPADVILVDEVHRQPIGRAFLTIVLDVCTRMICGFSVSLEHPGALSCALALSHAILPKDEWMKEHQLEADWPIWGAPRMVHADNAKEFRGTSITRGCEEYGIIVENRPRGMPHFGGHVERAFRTFMRATQRLRGTTFSGVYHKLNYNSEGKAILTIKEYERWFAIYVAMRYHNKKHRGTGYPPLNLYRKHVHGDDHTPGIGLPAPVADRRRLMLDFLPFISRAITREGVVFEHIHYWHDSLRRWIGTADPQNTKESRKFTFAYDPRDLGNLYFFDPELREYFAIPYRNRSHPPASIWELKAARKELAKDPQRRSNEAMIFKAIELQRETEESAAEKTKKARRGTARRAGWSESRRTLSASSNTSQAPSAAELVIEDDDLPVKGFAVDDSPPG